MDELVGAQYAVFVAMQTLKTRCSALQQRVITLEEENVNLRLQGIKASSGEGELCKTISLTDYDKLKAHVAELTEQKEHLLYKVKMVKSENEEVWSRLKQLSHVNQDLGSKLNKLTTSINQYATKKAHSPLIRSKTFTQDQPQTKILQKQKEEENLNGKTCTELEEISLKIIAQTKNELDSFRTELNNENGGMENLISDSCGFYYNDDEFDENSLNEFNALLEELKTTKLIVQNQKRTLQLALNKINKLQEIKTKPCDKSVPLSKETEDKSVGTESDLTQVPVPTVSTQTNNSPDIDEKYCPVCCRFFDSSVKFSEFTNHVEGHFREEDSYEIL